METLTVTQREAKIKAINSLIYACKLTANRSDILALWGVDSFDDMLDSEIIECQAFMAAAHRAKTTLPSATTRKLRSQVMTLLNKAGKYATSDDWTEVNRFLLQRKVCGRLLYMLTDQELSALIRKLRAIVDKKNQAPAAPEPQPQPTQRTETMLFSFPAVAGTMLVN